MDLLQQILALLKQTFPGVREDGLQQLAAALSLQVETQEQATELVGKLSAEKVEKFVKDWRSKADAEIGKASQTYETSLKEKYDFVEKGVVICFKNSIFASAITTSRIFFRLCVVL